MSRAPSSTASRRSKPPPYEQVQLKQPSQPRWWQLDRPERDLVAISLAVKVLLFPS